MKYTLSGPAIERLGRGPEFVSGRLTYYKTAVLAYFPDYAFAKEHGPLPKYRPETTYQGAAEESAHVLSDCSWRRLCASCGCSGQTGVSFASAYEAAAISRV